MLHRTVLLGLDRACGRNISADGCVSVQFPYNDLSYSQICGRVTGYQYSINDGLHSSNDIDDYYVDGVSITRGCPRQHVWTLISGTSDHHSNACPCNNGSTVSVLVINTSVNQGILTAVHPLTNSTRLIHSGMVKVVVLLNHLVVMLLVSHGFTETMVALPLLTILS